MRLRQFTLCWTKTLSKDIRINCIVCVQFCWSILFSNFRKISFGVTFTWYEILGNWKYSENDLCGIWSAAKRYEGAVEILIHVRIGCVAENQENH